MPEVGHLGAGSMAIREACVRPIENGDPECPEMPRPEAMRIMEITDQARKSQGYECPTLP